ncbi:MAG: hypothetical protein Ct9H300mP25_17080 [Acidobacteriota bacterium]|nr:MAG: hypothetical protein Ct9H300mP25_17080 [Acidobacteriota bacterium]
MSGELVWETSVADYRAGYYMTWLLLWRVGKLWWGPQVANAESEASLQRSILTRVRRCGGRTPCPDQVSQAMIPGRVTHGRPVVRRSGSRVLMPPN